MRTQPNARDVTCCIATLVLLLTHSLVAFGQANTITVEVDKPGVTLPHAQFGIFFEDINFGADGGLYPERVKNRSFEFADPMMGWKKIERTGAKGTISVRNEQPLNSNTAQFLRLDVDVAGEGFGIANEGFKGIGVEKGAIYNFSVYARRTAANTPGLRIGLVNASGQLLGQAKLKGFTTAWKRYSVEMRATETETKATLNLYVEGRGTLDLDLVSLFPKATWMNRQNGLRPDLVQLLKDLKPGFVRFPGGCIVEGRVLDTRYQWKKTIGDLAERKLIINRWNDEFKHKPAPDYFQSFGLGFYEYFLLCEDIGAEPLPILNCGMACQFNSKELAPLEGLDPYIQDALDLIEFANGSAATTWGRKRAEMGHPKPFNMKLLGVGNEQWGPQYIERYELFAKALKKKHPEIRLISSAGPSASGERFDFLWGKLRALDADIVDEHYYMPPKWFLENSGRYDGYPRTGPKVFAGEFAAQSSGVAKPDNRNNWECALSEAAFMTGLERNADVVALASYAPLFGHIEAWQWTPNLIWFDNLRSYGTPNYYVQKLFSANRGTNILAVQINGSPKNGQQGLYASALSDARTGEIILKLVNATARANDLRINLSGAGKIEKSAKALVMAEKDLKAENSLDAPTRVAPVEQKLTIDSPEFSFTLQPQSVTVLRITKSKS